MKIRSLILSLVVVFAHLTNAAGSDAEPTQLLMAAPGLTISNEDLDRFATLRVPPERRAASLARDGAIRMALEGIYIVRFLANEAEASIDEYDSIDLKQIEWEAQYSRDRALMSAYLDARVAEAMEGLDFTDLAKEEYLADQDKWVSEEARRASHVLVSTEERTDEEALARALEARARLVAGDDFAEVAKEYSDDGSVERNGGDLGRFGRGRMVGPFEEAAFGLEVGEVSEPVKTRFGYHVIRLDATFEETVKPFEEVEPQIVKGLMATRKKEIRERMIEDVKREAGPKGLVINQEAIEALEAQYGAAAEPAPES